MLRDFLKRLIVRKDLTSEEAEEMMRYMLDEATPDSQIAALLVALIHKGEIVDEIVGFARVIREMYEPLHSSNPQLLDIAGTGGDRDTFNISTAAAFVIAGAGLAVAKHGKDVEDMMATYEQLYLERRIASLWLLTLVPPMQ